MRKKIEPIGTPPDEEGNVTDRYRAEPDKISVNIKGSHKIGVLSFGSYVKNTNYLETMLRLREENSREIHDIKKFISREVEDIWYNEKEELNVNYKIDNPEKEKELQEFFEKHCLGNTLFNSLLKKIKAGRHTLRKGSKEIIAFDLNKYEELERLIQARERELIRKEKALEKLKREENEKKSKYKRSGHLTDQILKYDYPKKIQPSLFDTLKKETIKEIEVAGVHRSQVVEGIKLSPSETKVIDSLCKLLHESSQTLNSKTEDYYTGNMDYETVEYGEDKETPAPKLAFTLYELTKEYKGGDYVAGKDIENVKQILTELDNKRFLISYKETTMRKDGSRIERKIEDFNRLIKILKISQTEFNKEDVELSKQEETIIVLNPIFRRQIDSKFILYPNDINRRTIIAYGSHNVSDVAFRLRDYLMRELTYKHYTPEINLDKLYYFLAEKWMKESRKKKVKEYTEKALETVIAMGLLLSYEIKNSSTEELKVVFKLNKSWI